ncbi:tRNA (adenosine(37)-N6)-threonylcarbamoyltransferase complex dimerization subunit type 1 TsaB [Buchnera aphidicola]|uniref:tRNA (adenosine(37)-N6)-threonylcarbamoyltransferase complex dimerization subunit type 1 TsaB n=1 Tax=Buchnera aphidicola TaxID=9 RepID=UPI003464E8A0
MYETILSIDTSLNYCSISILKNEKIDSEFKICKKNHEKYVLSCLKLLLIRNNIKMNHIKMISFSNGPGNFTGIRIASSIALGLSIPYNIPVIGISTLIVLAEQAWRKERLKKVIICIKSGKKNIYWGQYIKNPKNIWVGKKTEVLLNIDEAYKKISSLKNQWNIIGDGNIYFKSIQNTFLKFYNIIEPHSQDLIPLTISKIRKKKINFFSIKHIKLNYLNTPIYKKHLKS